MRVRAHYISLVQIGPNVSIGRNVTVGAGARVRESILLDGASVADHACIVYSIVGWNSTVGAYARVEGTPTAPNPNMAFAKMDSRPLFNDDGRLNPTITILGKYASPLD
jgi:mannose-1-phosphate guanylyltransferase